jgi:GLPGLI family protein
MRFWIGLIAVFGFVFVQGQTTYKISYQKTYNGSVIQDQDKTLVFASSDFTHITSEQIQKGTKEFPFEETFVNRKQENSYQQIASVALGATFGFLDSLALQRQEFEFFKEERMILGYKCKKARAIINSNTFDIWYTDALNIKGSPTVLGMNLGLVLEINRNGNYLIQATKIERVNTKKNPPKTNDFSKVKRVDNITYRDLLWKSRFVSIGVFEDEIINFSDQSVSNDSILRFGNGTIILKKINFPAIELGSQIFAELTTWSNGDAYDRTGSVFIIPTDNKLSFFDALENGIKEIPLYTNGNTKEYRGVVRTDEYTPLIELMRFFTPFGIKQYNHINLKGKDWHNKVSYRQDISELQPELSSKELYVGVFIGNYDQGGHKVNLEITIHNERTQSPKNLFSLPLFNTTNVMEMSGQNYATMFDSENGLSVTFNLDQSLKNAKLRYITTGHGGWANGDEFLPKKNTILLNGKEVFSFTPWRQDCGSYRLYNPASGNFENGLSSSDYSRSNWCPGTLTNPILIDLGNLEKGTHTLTIKIPQGTPEGNSFSAWNVSGILFGE